MADQQLRGNKIRVFQVQARQSLRKHYKPSKVKYFAICKYCLSEINYKFNYPALLVHLTIYHTELLTEAEKTNRHIQWIWDYFTPTSYGGRCNICHSKIKSVGSITKHLNIHRRKHNIFDPDEVIYEDTYMYGASTSASGSMIVEEYQEASIPLASNLTDDTGRTCVPNESATKTSEPSEHVTNNPLEHMSVDDNMSLEVPAELELYDKEEVPVEEEVLFMHESPVIGEEFQEVFSMSRFILEMPTFRESCCLHHQGKE